ncbi:hypothetical protein J5N97_015651 [Dioscorea zingiberensis]|uniref:C2 NT-type domain-containing protein n=1 Tax=Dioscorea zingiberensis TaxID=325984 RepID=A0A9D5CHY5_9LILI|nr:hypothetical protein J5N97_015651 [Dioscorea zingiberensis]
MKKLNIEQREENKEKGGDVQVYRHRSNSFGEKHKFKFSNLQAFKVPRGWDKLLVSIVSVETGKTIAKSSKTVVHGGTCQWTDSISESIWVSQGVTSKELEECLYKIVVSMGSSRSGLLGDVVLNLSDYVHSRDSALLSLPLERVASSSTNLAGTGYPDVPVNRDRSFSASDSHHSSDSDLPAAEETIDELRDEVKMWGRHSQNLNLDLEILKENSLKSKHQANHDVELFAAFSKRDSFKQELEQLKLSLEESMTKQTVNGSAKIEEIIRLKEELGDELKFLRESNANLSLQLKKTQESNIELIAILQELEETVEKQGMEITNLSEQAQANDSVSRSNGRLLLDLEAEWASKLSMKEEIKKLEEKLSVVLQTQVLKY